MVLDRDKERKFTERPAEGTKASSTRKRRYVRRAGWRTVRKARERRGISRRVLAELSQVSLRYLAQLEGGKGNISIALLGRVSLALDRRIAWLVGADDPWSSEVVRFSEFFRSATGPAPPCNATSRPGRCNALAGEASMPDRSPGSRQVDARKNHEQGAVFAIFGIKSRNRRG